MSLQSIDPTTGEPFAQYEETNPDQIDSILREATKAFCTWRSVSFEGRAEVLRKAAAILREERSDFARLMAREMGKPIRQGRSEAEKCAWVCDYYADNAEEFLRAQSVETDASRSYVAFVPVGPVLAVMPWNFPFWQVFRFVAPALMAGNVAIVKHASNVSGCALAIADIFSRSGLPKGAFSTVLLRGADVLPLIADRAVAAVTVTGSTPAGRMVAAAAGKALKKSVLELGGSDPYLVLEDADLDLAAKACVTSRLINTGQSCIAAKRFIVIRSRLAEFENKVVAAMESATMGDPANEETDLGPLARLDLREELHRQVEQSVQRGAKLLLGGSIPDGPGAFYPATVLTNVAPGMPAHDEELFGPVAAIVPAVDEADAVFLANHTVFGLGAAVFSADLTRAERVAAEIETGSVFINGFVKSDPRLPFGGIKESGYGRELGPFGIREFVNIKTRWIR
ncbi:MAG: NAD-dependent succinate-semialdehyde dehydrogenase [Deltaproteobacteria bacterium]|nr:NAD-dependent succinate-semialdehyde dehydrogenase [Deltaproteobacteria bacterium]